MYCDNNNIEGVIENLCHNMSENESEEFMNLTEENLTKEFLEKDIEIENNDRIVELLSKNNKVSLSQIMEDFTSLHQLDFKHLYRCSLFRRYDSYRKGSWKRKF